MTDPAAILNISHFYTTLTVHVGGDRQRHNIIGTDTDGDWHSDHVTYFRNAADRELAGLGYRRSGDWVYDHTRDELTATLTEARP